MKIIFLYGYVSRPSCLRMPVPPSNSTPRGMAKVLFRAHQQVQARWQPVPTARQGELLLAAGPAGGAERTRVGDRADALGHRTTLQNGGCHDRGHSAGTSGEFVGGKDARRWVTSPTQRTGDRGAPDSNSVARWGCVQRPGRQQPSAQCRSHSRTGGTCFPTTTAQKTTRMHASATSHIACTPAGHEGSTMARTMAPTMRR